MSHRMNDLFAELDRQIDGEVLSDISSRMLYSTDASPYQKRPVAVVRPRHAGDCVAIMKFASAHRIPLIPRAAGTSLAGQCVGEGLVVDFTRHMNRVLKIDTNLRRASVEPGVICDDLNEALCVHGLMFAPDPSTASRCTIAGMLGNNAWGAHAPCYGATRDHVVSVEAVLSDGQRVRFGPLDSDELRVKLHGDDGEAHIYREVFDVVDRHRDMILQHYPRPDGISRNAGYPLDVLALGQPWEPSGLLFNIARLLCGSEGTLTLLTDIELNLVPRPSARRLIAVHFMALEEALESVAHAVAHAPAALELVDWHILALTRQNLEQRRNRFWLEGDPAAVLLVEFQHAGQGVVREQAQGLVAELRQRRLGYAYVELDPPALDQVWALRAAGLGLLMGTPGRAKPVTGIEDSAVPVAALVDYVKAVRAIMMRHGTDCVVYGPAGQGVLHFRPALDLSLAYDRQEYARILDEVAGAASAFGGTFSSKHGDGRLRGPFLARQLGEEVVSLLRRIKAVFDPMNLLNPGKLFDSPPVTEDLRATSDAEKISTVFDWSGQVDFRAATQNCNGAGVCLKSAGRGTMCPSFMATREERHGTRGRANIFRQVMSGREGWSGAGDDLLREVLDLCISCKGCKSECPANVDMARMKAEFLQHLYDGRGVPWRVRLAGGFDRFSRIGGIFPGPVNAVLKQRWVKTLLGFDQRRSLPRLANRRFSHWLRLQSRQESVAPLGNVVLYNDLFSEFYEPHVAIAAFRILERLGWRVTVSPALPSGRVQISQGLLRQARERLTRTVEWLYPHAAAGRPIVGVEPSEILTFRDEAVDLLESETLKRKARCVAEQSLLFDELIGQHAKDLDTGFFRPLRKRFLLHGHCHQKALVGMADTVRTLQMIPGSVVDIIPSGCCGMAGVFGYERTHYGVSLEIAELVLFPALRQRPADSLVVAPGVSCRQQIEHGLEMRAYHPAEALCTALCDG